MGFYTVFAYLMVKQYNGRMNLQTKLAPRGAKSSLSKKLNISMTWVSLVVNGKKKPSLKLALEIERETGVRVSDFWKEVAPEKEVV